MAKKIDLEFTVRVTIELTDGKESTRGYVAEEIRQHLEDDSNPGAVYGDKDGQYDVTKWVVSAGR